MLELLDAETQDWSTGIHGHLDVDGAVGKETDVHTTVDAGTVGQDMTGSSPGQGGWGGCCVTVWGHQDEKSFIYIIYMEPLMVAGTVNSL